MDNNFQIGGKLEAVVKPNGIALNSVLTRALTDVSVSGNVQGRSLHERNIHAAYQSFIASGSPPPSTLQADTPIQTSGAAIVMGTESQAKKRKREEEKITEFVASIRNVDTREGTSQGVSSVSSPSGVPTGVVDTQRRMQFYAAIMDPIRLYTTYSFKIRVVHLLV